MGRAYVELKVMDQPVKGSRALLNAFPQHKKTHFRDVITGDDSPVFINAAPSPIWLSSDDELPTHPQHPINADGRVIIALWRIQGLAHVNWLRKDARINAVYFRDETLIQISQKLQTNASGRHRPWTVVRKDSTKVVRQKLFPMLCQI
jgi:hypothetical protein